MVLQGVLEVGQYVVVSTDKQIAISCGHVQALTTQTVSLLLDRYNLTLIYKYLLIFFIITANNFYLSFFRIILYFKD